MEKNYTTIDSLFAKLEVDIRGDSIGELDIVVWASEAMGLLDQSDYNKVSVLLNVKEFGSDIPQDCLHIIQMIKYLGNVKDKPLNRELMSVVKRNVSGTMDTLSGGSIFAVDSGDQYILKGDVASYRAYFTFKDGVVICTYSRLLTDPATGHPLIPDNANYLEAICYYIKWKVSERGLWNNRQGSGHRVQYYQRQWLVYRDKVFTDKFIRRSSLDDEIYFDDF